MRRLIRVLSTIAVLSTAMSIQTTSLSASSAAGVSTATVLVPPAATTGLTLRAVVSARDGGMYFAYQNATGDNYSLVKQKADKSFDSSFGVGGVATVSGLNPTQYPSRRLSITSDLNGKWWAVSSSGTSSGSAPAVVLIATGGSTGQTIASNTLNASSLATICTTGNPTLSPSSWGISSITLSVKRNSGAWLSAYCSGTVGSASVTATTLFAIKADLSIDPSISPIGLNGQLGSSVTCHSPSMVSDPTGASSSPELWVIRAEHTKVTNGVCDFQATAASQVTGYDVLRFSSTGVMTRTTFVSPDDASEAFFAVRLDPGGRPLLVGTTFSDATKMVLVRLNTNATVDTSVGTNGFRTLSIGAVPAGAVSVRAAPFGIITSAENVYVTILLTDQQRNSFTCSSTTPLATGLRIAVVSFSNGPSATFGTSGVSDRVTATNPENAVCLSALTTGGQSVDTAGNPRIVISDSAVFKYVEWARPSDATGGSDGGTGTGGYTKDTGGAPSLGEGATSSSLVLAKLPVKTAVNNAYKIQSSAQVKKYILNSITPRVCLGAQSYVITISAGTCTVRVKAIADGSILRVQRTVVTTKNGTAGSSVTATVLPFTTTRTAVTATNKANIATLSLSSAPLVVVAGHAASMTDSKAFNESIARKRANNVKTVILKANKSANVFALNLGVDAPLTTKTSEAAQAKNRRVVIYIVS